MEYRTILKANIKRHKGSLIGIFLLLTMVSVSLGTVISVWIHSNRYISSEINRVGFGSLTAWVSDVPDIERLQNSIENLAEIEQTEIQNLIYSDYEINGQESDSEGQLIVYSSNNNKYRFFTNKLTEYKAPPQEIARGEIYVAPSMISMFDIQIGDEISFPIARQGENRTRTFIVKGYYEDPFMGSSMIGMKGFLICEDDYRQILDMIDHSGIDALASSGAMIHIFTDTQFQPSFFQINELLSESSELSAYIKFIYSENTITNFMLVLQNAFSGLMIAFVMILLCAAAVILGHSISGAIDTDYKNMGILKTIGFTSRKLRYLQIIPYLISVIMGILLGFIFSIPCSHLVAKITLTTTGALIPAVPVFSIDIFAFGSIIVLIMGLIIVKTRKIGYITPIKAIMHGAEETFRDSSNSFKIRKKGLYIHLAMRELVIGRRKYRSVCYVAATLVFFASLVGRMNLWLGSDGKGMMDAFNPADHDIGVQAMGTLTEEEFEKTIDSYTGITDEYLLAMLDVTVNGIRYSANIITEPERFHILQGETCLKENEVVITEMAANDLGISIGDTVIIGANSKKAEFIVSGIYQCANDMGKNIGMNREGYLNIGQDDLRIWCHHYFLEDTSQKQAIQEKLESSYGGDIHIHENTWPGLYGMISAMNALIAFLYGMITIFILIVTGMTGNRILSSEQKNMGIYKAIGFSVRQLRFTFALRFGMTAFIGSVIGLFTASLFSDRLISSVMKLVGIGNFVSKPGIGNLLIPAIVVTFLFASFAYLTARKLKKTDLTILTAE